MLPSEWMAMHGGRWPGPMPEDGQTATITVPAARDVVTEYHELLERADVKRWLASCRICPSARFKEPGHCSAIAALCGCGAGSIVDWIRQGGTCPDRHWRK